MKRRLYFLFPSILASIAGAVLIGGIVFAQDSTPSKPTMAQESHHEEMKAHGAMGMHDMPATVTEVDHKTGVVEVESGNMQLKVHFPANAVADLKKGDKITLHMGFSKQ
jgi:hypothetical protein